MIALLKFTRVCLAFALLSFTQLTFAGDRHWDNLQELQAIVVDEANQPPSTGSTVLHDLALTRYPLLIELTCLEDDSLQYLKVAAFHELLRVVPPQDVKPQCIRFLLTWNWGSSLTLKLAAQIKALMEAEGEEANAWAAVLVATATKAPIHLKGMTVLTLNGIDPKALFVECEKAWQSILPTYQAIFLNSILYHEDKLDAREVQVARSWLKEMQSSVGLSRVVFCLFYDDDLEVEKVLPKVLIDANVEESWVRDLVRQKTDLVRKLYDVNKDRIPKKRGEWIHRYLQR